MKDKKKSDGAHEAMLGEGQVPQIVSKETKKADEYEALQSFLRSISSTATLPPYVKGETYSSTKGVLNQCLITCAVLILAAGAGHPIGFSAVALPQLRIENSTMRIDDEMGSWIDAEGVADFLRQYMEIFSETEPGHWQLCAGVVLAMDYL